MREAKFVVTDFMMPLLDGMEMIHAMRADGVDVPIVLTSAVPGRDGDLYQGFLQKPHHEDRLAALVERLLAGGTGGPVPANEERRMSP